MKGDIITIPANGLKNAYDVIINNGFTDGFPELDFYEYSKFYKKDNKKYIFHGWNMKKYNGKYSYPSLNLKEI